jgi:2,4-dienoyl-CoA reductase-like NADH-dependent reductase (Old Yellow Enzyme family)
MTDPHAPLTFASGHRMPNRFLLAPMTNRQSHADGTLSDDEYRWLVRRAEGGFGMVMTCAAHVQAGGQGFPGQLGIWDDRHLPGLHRLAAGIRAHGSLAVVQLHHAGARSPAALLDGPPVAPSEDPETGARALTTAEVTALRDAFIRAAERAREAGFDGVEVHGAHGYILTQFLSAETNRRTDAFGGSPENRARLLFDVVDGIRAACGEGFLVGVRLSPERFGLDLAETRAVAGRLMTGSGVDFLDVSLWDAFKMPEDPRYADRPLMARFTEIDRGAARLTVAGKITGGAETRRVLDAGVDFAGIGRSGILHHDFPRRVAADPAFVPVPNPVSPDYLAAEGLGPAFVEYMRRWPGFVTEAG